MFGLSNRNHPPVLAGDLRGTTNHAPVSRLGGRRIRGAMRVRWDEGVSRCVASRWTCLVFRGLCCGREMRIWYAGDRASGEICIWHCDTPARKQFPIGDFVGTMIVCDSAGDDMFL